MDISRCRRYLASKNVRAASEASEMIDRYLQSLKTTPEMGRLLPGPANVRELVISFGDAGYVARYRFDHQTDSVIATGLRHQREANR